MKLEKKDWKAAAFYNLRYDEFCTSCVKWQNGLQNGVNEANLLFPEPITKPELMALLVEHPMDKPNIAAIENLLYSKLLKIPEIKGVKLKIESLDFSLPDYSNLSKAIKP